MNSKDVHIVLDRYREMQLIKNNNCEGILTIVDDLQRAVLWKKFGGSLPIPSGHWFMSMFRKSISITALATNLKRINKKVYK